MSIAERIKAARAALKLKQEEVVSISGIPLSTYRKYEGGTAEPGSKALAGLTCAGMNANWLLTGEGPMFLSEIDELEGAKNLLKQAVEQRDALAGSLQSALEDSWARPSQMSAEPLGSGAAEKTAADEHAARSEASWITDPSDEDRLQMLLILLRTMEHRLRTPVEQEVAARMLDAIEAWREFARNRPEILARLEAVRTAAGIYLDP